MPYWDIAQSPHSFFYIHTLSSKFFQSREAKKAKPSSNGKANTVLPPGTRGAQPFLICSVSPVQHLFDATCMTFDFGLLTFYGPIIYTLTDVWKTEQ